MTAMADPLVATPLFQGVHKKSAGYKLLSSMGWREGEGLGAQKQGITEHVKVKKKHDAMGVGAAENAQNLRNWTTGMVSFDRILSNLKEVTASRPAAGADSGDESSEEEPEDKPKAKKPKKTDKKKVKGAKRKRASPSSDSDASSSDSDSSSDEGEGKGKGGAAQAAAAAATAAASAKRLKIASHVGRYTKRERAKFVKNYSASDLDAILGGAAVRDAADSENGDDDDGSAGAGASGMLPDAMGFMPVIAEVRAVHAADGAASSSGDDEDVEEPGATAGRPRTAAGTGDGAREASGSAAAANILGANQRRRKEKQPAAPVEEEWEPGKKPWWAGMFARAGRMGSIRQELRAGREHGGKAKINVTGFKEQDQENLYEQAQNGAAHGRQGLGRSDMPKKVAGARWCGTKTKLGDGDDDDDDDEEGNTDPEGRVSGSGSGSESEEDTRVVVVQSKKEQAAAAATTAAAGAQVEPSAQAQSGPGAGSAGEDVATKCKGTRKKGGKEAQREGEDGSKAAGEEQDKGKKKKKKKSKKDKKSEEAKEASASEGADGAAADAVDGGGALKPPKWRKLVRQLLADAPERRLKLRRLRKQLEVSHGLGGSGAGKKTVGGDESSSEMAAVLEQLRSSKKFVVCEKFVTLTK